MAHETVKVILEASYTYSDFEGWFNSLEKFEKEVWLHLAKDPTRTENNSILLTKKAMELYCLEMDIDYIPNSEEYLDTIYRRLITNLILISLLEKEMLTITSGKLSFLTDATFELTERGKNYLKKSE